MGADDYRHRSYSRGNRMAVQPQAISDRCVALHRTSIGVTASGEDTTAADCRTGNAKTCSTKENNQAFDGRCWETGRGSSNSQHCARSNNWSGNRSIWGRGIVRTARRYHGWTDLHRPTAGTASNKRSAWQYARFRYHGIRQRCQD